ncbi:MAG: arginine--tRNA ligase [Bdellovibrionaceae bacterium]|nr:arginine--tRNA ligase [Pseudobdellovibrionaceae bacterium]|tara:strand:+ start:4484 stop:6217 length:1734 start_codon:yes stop_codon:yes gene_type:complete
MDRFTHFASKALSQVLETPISPDQIETPPDPTLGDFGFPCFKLAKSWRKAPPVIAQELCEKLNNEAKESLGPLDVRAVGPYVNFNIDPQALGNAILGEILEGDGLGTYGKLPSGRGKWVLEYSSPNVAKPFQIYHLRGTALGAALARVGTFRGYEVTSINHLGDWGTQYGKLAVAFKEFGNELPEKPTMDQLVDIYIRVHKIPDENGRITEEAREAFKKLEEGDPEITALWKKCKEISVEHFNEIYQRIGVHFDYTWGESHYKDQLEPLIAQLKEQGLLEESEGAWVVFVEDENGNEIPPCILLKKDGATIYATRDLAAALYRYKQFQFDRMTYIVGQEQKMHFKQVFAVLRKMKVPWVSACEHIPTGLYRFNDSKMSTRKGNVASLESILDLAKKRVLELMTERDKDSLIENLDETAEKIAIGAVLFHDLSHDPTKDIELNIDRMVDFQGETGPYLQYAHTRCLSILRKAKESGHEDFRYKQELISALIHPKEWELLKILGQFPSQLERTLYYGKANQLANYLVEITKAFHSFYRECHVLDQEPSTTQARLLLVESTRRILGQGLLLLGVPLPERM